MAGGRNKPAAAAVPSRLGAPKLSGLNLKQQQQQAAAAQPSPRQKFGPLGGRSKSVQASRNPNAPGNNPGVQRYGNGHDVKEYDKPKAAPAAGKRPSSMHTITNREKIAAAAGAAPPMKGKAAFGSAVDKPPANPRLAARSPSPARSSNGRGGNEPAARRGESKVPAMNGFAKLQMKVAGGGGGPVRPVVVTYDDDDDGGHTNDRRGGGGGRGSGLRGGRESGGELRGQSEYLRVDTNDDMMSGDQLDRLLLVAKKAYVR